MQPSHVSLWLRPDTPSEGEQEAFAKLKHILRKFGARTKEVLIEAMSQALGAVSTQDVRGFFAHCGYRTPRSNSERRCQHYEIKESLEY